MNDASKHAKPERDVLDKDRSHIWHPFTQHATECDPTVIYALGTRRRLFERDYRTPSRYNTYLIDGLPPHAIAQPSAATIEAALYPRASDFLFFVAGPGGRHIFSRTYREHIAAIRQVRDR